MINSRSSILKSLFEVDVRSLALLRIGMALVILWDILFYRWPMLELFYTDTGILPGELVTAYSGTGYWSLYLVDGSERWASALLITNVIAAIGLLFGFKTRTMTAACLVLAWSLHTRNPLVITGGHILLRTMLFWSIFLPLGAVWSLDEKFSKYARPERFTIVSVASAAIMLQLAFMYFFTGISKLNDAWLAGTAIESALHLEMFVKPVGDWLRGFPGLLKILTYTTLWVEIIGPILLFVPRINLFARGALMALFVMLHLGIAASLSIGIFSAMAIVAWSVFIPGQFWNTVLGKPDGFEKSYSPVLPWLRTVCNVVCAFFLAFVLLMNVANIDPVKSQSWFGPVMRNISMYSMTDQVFKMFSKPPELSPGFKYNALQSDGKTVDLFEQLHYGETGSKPVTIYQYLHRQGWRRCHELLITPTDDEPNETVKKIRMRMLLAQVERWNRSHSSEEQVVSAKLDCHERPIQRNGRWGGVKKTTWADWRAE